MARAVWNGVVLAESDRCEQVEGNAYFPADSIQPGHFRPGDTTTYCGWKGEANYYNIVVGGQINADAAWYYPDPKPEAK
jgi:uncharacterized protein (DUF427 family)